MSYGERYYINRELSWLEFNRRVLQEATVTSQPILERLKYISIFASNLDEFFMVRVASIKDQVAVGFEERDASGMVPVKQLKLITKKAHELVKEEYAEYTSHFTKQLNEEGVHLLEYSELDDVHRLEADRYFDDIVYPVLTPMAVDFSRPFPLISNKSLNICAFVEDPAKDEGHLFATVQVPQMLPRLVKLGSKKKNEIIYVFLETLIRHHLGKLFFGKKIVESHIYRITRSGDLSVVDDDAEDLLLTIEKSLRQRRWGAAVRLEVSDTIGAKMLGILKEAMNLKSADVYVINGPIDLTFGFWLYDQPRHEYLIQKRVNHYPPIDLIGKEDLFAAIKDRDLMIHMPYESFEPVIEFIKQASMDPDVLAIKQTLYRVSGNSPIINALAEAAELGKQVTALVEIQARFDEQNNINWAKRLERAGCHVIYGLEGLKTHAKICMVVRREAGGIKRYIHFGTGNYNDITARFYTDIGIFTCNQEMAEDATEFFNTLSGYSDPIDMYQLTVAPYTMRMKLEELLHREMKHAKAGKASGIVIKLNSLVDPEVIDLLYKTSQAGVKIQLIIRGMCCLIPGIPSISENIQVYSLVGTYLEHSRILSFENDGNPEVYITSADLMERNLDRRVELLIPVLQEEIVHRIRDILNVYLKDNVKLKQMLPDGSYVKIDNGEDPYNAQIKLEDQARKRFLRHLSNRK